MATFAGEDWYVSAKAAVEAARRRTMFNVIHASSGLKAEIVVARGTADDEARFARFRRVSMPDGRSEPFASPEDVILKKLECFREGGSETHLRGTASMVVVQGVQSLDRGSLEAWADPRGVAAELARVQPG